MNSPLEHDLPALYRLQDNGFLHHIQYSALYIHSMLVINQLVHKKILNCPFPSMNIFTPRSLKDLEPLKVPLKLTQAVKLNLKQYCYTL